MNRIVHPRLEYTLDGFFFFCGDAQVGRGFFGLVLSVTLHQCQHRHDDLAGSGRAEE